MTPLYTLSSVTKRYNGSVALDIPALAIFEGTTYLLAGPNGSGKSTLLNILAFLAAPSSGTIEYAGREVDGKQSTLGRLRNEVTLLHQSPYLFDETVFANIAFGLRIRGIKGPPQRQRVEDSLAMVGLSGFGPRKAKALSGGESQRVALARALALSPRVLLLDEPFGNVDKETAGMLHGVIASLPGKGTTVVMATHDTSPQTLLKSQVIGLAEGKLTGETVRRKDREGRIGGRSGHAHF
ncbi:MAG TPA: ATP-binding cassette domain-containing protein [Candidatus Limnocylindria bacterium]|nr:ATP-binding cassette domain-containing protein [Candidatus Limnocylindria bacterium]